ARFGAKLIAPISLQPADYHLTLKPSLAPIDRLSLNSFRLDLAKASPKTLCVVTVDNRLGQARITDPQPPCRNGVEH
ncbi:hypothetical protein, partial [Mesorhizobium sp. M7A.F.Ca.CA.001.08.1.1]|uniref:hypothetical protein n=1 Tax=Mesorhizobium sp. M7A.F.Ca.CA.001.08.1.1 TaxID=2496691 RepID=UPI0013E368AA